MTQTLSLPDIKLLQSGPAAGVVTIYITIPINRNILSGILARGLRNMSHYIYKCFQKIDFSLRI